ncbi:insulinase family protein, partial [bacterium]|nr:insulinase family protein [bacterium]
MIIDNNNPELTVGKTIEGFEIKRIDSLPKLNNIIYQLEHQTTGALMIHLSNDDDNNCFGVAFRTTPTDSTGVAHILEHTALCGSKKYPVRDPFFSMIKRSMKTFMNAFTASDWTMYPFSTQNETDFYNLMGVYLDAAFFPLLSEKSFKQEGHRLEFSDLDNPETPLKVQGIVYSEMQGAMSSQSQIMHDCTGKSLFPTVTYKYNSGGDPSEILNLTHQNLKDFHKLHYHPSNSLFYTYGNLPLSKHLTFINDQALSKFKKIKINTSVGDENRYSEPKAFNYYYPLNESDDDGEKCQIALSWLACSIKEPLEIISMHIINLILLGHSGAPLRKKLLESNFGKSLADTTGFEDEIRETFFSAGLQGVAEKNIDKVEELILSTLNNVVEDGITQEQIDSAIHQIEFDTKEISGGHYPYSLNLLFRFFGTWLHGGDPVSTLDFDHTLEQIKQKIVEGPFLENQIKKYLIDNPHRAKIVLKPDTELEKAKNAELQSHLEKTKSGMSSGEKDRIIREAIDLQKSQEQKEDISCLPSLKVSDIPKKTKFLENYTEDFNHENITFYDQPTNGISYFNWYFKIDEISNTDRQWLPLLGSLLTNTGANGLTYGQMSEQINMYTGGFSASPSIEIHLSDQDSCHEYFTFSSKALNRNLGKMFEIAKMLMGTRTFEEQDRIQTLIAQRSNNLINSLVQSGHSYAASLANRNFSKSAQIEEYYGGVHQVQFMKQLCKMDKSELEKTTKYLISLFESLMRKDKLSILVIGEKDVFQESYNMSFDFFDTLKEGITELKPNKILLENTGISQNNSQNEAWLTTTPVSYVAKSLKTIDYSHQDSPHILVISNLIKSCFLHGEIREKGGAYGAMSNYNADDGIFSMLSYRDPHLARTTGIFDKALNW